jgi:hypothetical protein
MDILLHQELKENYFEGISGPPSGTKRKSGYNGDWIKIILSSFISHKSPSLQARAPGEWKFYGSNDSIIFTETTSANQLARLTTTVFSLSFYTKTLSPIITVFYQYIRWTFHKLCGNDAILILQKFKYLVQKK